LTTETVNTNELLISALVESNQIRLYAYFLKFKYCFSSSRLHDGNALKLSRLTKVSYKTVRVQLRKMVAAGWVRKDGDDYIFISKNELYKILRLPLNRISFKCRVQISVTESIRDIKSKLASKVLEANLHRQEFLYGLRRSFSYSSNSEGELRDKYTKKSSHRFLPMSAAGKTVLSCMGFGKMFGVSRSAGHKIKQDMIRLGLISATPNISLYRDVKGDYSRYLSVKAKYPKINVYYSHGKIYQRYPDGIALLAY